MATLKDVLLLPNIIASLACGLRDFFKVPSIINQIHSCQPFPDLKLANMIIFLFCSIACHELSISPACICWKSPKYGSPSLGTFAVSRTSIMGWWEPRLRHANARVDLTCTANEASASFDLALGTRYQPQPASKRQHLGYIGGQFFFWSVGSTQWRPWIKPVSSCWEATASPAR